jgi:hypothetical protein
MSRRFGLAAVVATCAGAGCFVFVPEPRDRIELATAQAHDSCATSHSQRSDEADVARRIVGPEAIDRVEPLYASVPSRSGHEEHFLGARLRIRPTPGMTAELLERTLRCHAARQTLGTEPALLDDPYVLPHGWVKIRVESVDGTFVVKLSSYDHAAAREILARSRAFVAAPRPSDADGRGGAAALPPVPSH